MGWAAHVVNRCRLLLGWIEPTAASFLRADIRASLRLFKLESGINGLSP
jgi:hypothetical protein